MAKRPRVQKYPVHFSVKTGAPIRQLFVEGIQRELTVNRRTHIARRTSQGVPASISAEVLRASPTQPPLADANAPSLTLTVTFVGALLSTAGLVAWLAAPFVV